MSVASDGGFVAFIDGDKVTLVSTDINAVKGVSASIAIAGKSIYLSIRSFVSLSLSSASPMSVYPSLRYAKQFVDIKYPQLCTRYYAQRSIYN